MLDSKYIDDMVARLSTAIPPGVTAVKNDLEHNFRLVLQGMFAKLDLVTREEFDVQAGVLAKTRAKLEALEKQVAALEAQAGGKSNSSTPPITS